MLFDPKWNQPSVAGFKAWLEKQPREQAFEYSDYDICAVGQYFKSIEMHPCETSHAITTPLNALADHADSKARTQGRLPTFGDVLAEIEKADQ